MRLISYVAWLLIALGLLAVGTLAMTLVPAYGGDCPGSCACGCDGERACPKCAAGGEWWVVEDTGGDQVGLWVRGAQVGSWRVSDQTYHPRLGPGRWGEAREPPAAVPECYRRAATNYGVSAPAAGEARGWSVSGKPVSAGEARQALAGGPALPDDAGRPYVLWVGDDATGARLKADAGDRARVQAVPPGHWMTLDRDGKAIYTPGLWFVRADGTAVGHEAAYRGADQLAEGLRRCAPDWRPDAVPGLTPPVRPVPPSLPAFPAAAAVPGGLLTGGALTLLALFARRLLARQAA